MVDTYIIDVVAPIVGVEVSAPTVNVTLAPDPVFSVIVLEGPSGPRGAPGTGTRIIGEVPAGSKNSSNMVFLTENQFISGTTIVYRNGLREHLGVGYTETLPETITFTTPPNSDDDILVDYVTT